MNPPWSKLEKSALWNMARRAYAQDSWRTYHAFSRVSRLYGLAAHTFGFGYCASLDRAILCRSVVMAHSEPVRASADWLQRRLPFPDPVAESLIVSTRLSIPGGDNRMILLNLAAYAFAEHRAHAIELQRLELRRRFEGISERDLNFALISRLRDLANNIRIGLEGARLPKADIEYFDAIHSGLKSALGCLTTAKSGLEEAMT